jgi:hypothetical protein
LPFSGASSILMLYTISFDPFPPTSFSIVPHFILPSISWSISQPVVSKFIHNTFWEILFSSILCTCPNQRNLLNLIVSVIVGFLTFAYIFYWSISSNFLFYCHILGLKFFYTLSF